MTLDYTPQSPAEAPSLIDVAMAIAELLPFEDVNFSFRKFISYILEEIDAGETNQVALQQAAERTVHEIFRDYEHKVEDREDRAIAVVQELFSSVE